MFKFEVVQSVKSKQDLLEFARSFGDIYDQSDDTDHDGIVTLDYNPSIHKYAFGNQALFPHTDRSNMNEPPNKVILWCEREAEHGGESLMFDANEHLLPVIDDINFRAIFASENDDGYIHQTLYNPKTNIFRFRNDAHIWVNPLEHTKFQRVVELINANTTTLRLNEGECIVINNRTMFHGRKAYAGTQRVMHRVLVYDRTPD